MSESSSFAIPRASLLTEPERLRALLRLLPVAIIVVDARGGLLEFNPATQVFWGEPLPSVHSMEDYGQFEAYRPGSHERLRAEEWPLAQTLRTGQAVAREELELRSPAGRRFTVLVSTAPLRDARGTLEGALAVVLDITARRRAEQAVAARDELIAIATHELRSPLSTLQLQIDALERLLVRGQPLHASRLSTALHQAHRQVVRLGRLVAHLLDLALLTTGELRLEREPLELGELMRQVVDSLEELLVRAGCSVRLQAPQPVTGHFDRLRLELVLTNLLTNAIKYAPALPLELSLEQQQGYAVLSVRDHGPGIPLEAQARIFERFQRASGVHNRDSLGLGLYVSREIARAHGGELTVESPSGGGACFRLRLPLSS